MKGYVIIMTSLLMLSSTANAQKYTVALLAKLGGAKSDTSMDSTITNGSASRYKFHLNKEGFSGGLGIDVTRQQGAVMYGVEIVGYVDAFQANNKDGKSDLYDPTSPFLQHDNYDLKRNHTMEFSGKLGWLLGDGMTLYGKAGILYSKFVERYRDTGVDTKANFYALGGIIGLGAQKKYNSFGVGIEYDFHIYQRKTPKFSYGGHLNTAKTKPMYHNLYLTLSKSL